MAWCSDNALLLNVSKTNEMLADLLRNRGPPEPLSLNGQAVEQASNDLSWEVNVVSTLKKAHEHLNFLH